MKARPNEASDRDVYKWWVLFTVSLGSLTVALDQSILVTILPQLTVVFNTDSSVISWVNLVYYVMSLSLMLTLAKIGDAKGRKRVYMAGLAFYTAGMLGCALSQNVAQLITARAIQGVGAATGFTLSMAITVAVFPSDQRGRAIGILAGVNSAGLVVGPMVGGLLLDLLGWRGVFYGRAPLALTAIVMAWLIVKEQRAAEQVFRLDLPGAAGLFSFLTSLLLFLSLGTKWGFGSPSVVAIGGLSLASFLLFLIVESRSAEPILRLGLFRRRLFAAATASGFFNGCGASIMTFLVPFYLMQGLGFSGSAVGLAMALVAVPLLILSPLTGRLSDRVGTTVLCTVGMMMMSGGLFLLSRPIAHPSYSAIAVGVALVGIGTAFFLPPNNSAVVGSVPKEMLALASGVAVSTRQVGVSSGVAVAGGLFGAYQAYHVARLTAAGMAPLAAQRLGSVAGFGDAILFGAILSSAGIVTSLIRGSTRRG